MSDPNKPPPFDRLEALPVWKDGFDIRTERSKGAFRYHANRKRFFFWPWLPLYCLYAVLSIVWDEKKAIFGMAAGGFFAACFLWLALRSRRRWRLKGDVRRLTVTKAIGGMSWGRRDFTWDQIVGFESKMDVGTGYSDLVVKTKRTDHSLNFELTDDDADQLVDALVKMRIRAKMDALARSGYRGGVRAPNEAEEEAHEESLTVGNDSKPRSIKSDT